MDDYAGRVLADRYRLPLPPSDEYEFAQTRAFDTYSGQEVLVRQVPLPEVVEAEVLGSDGLPEGFTGRDGPRRPFGPGASRSSSDPAVRRAIEAAQAAAQIPDHPRLDQVFDVFAEGGSLWIVSEVVAAQPLAALLAERPLSPYRAAEVASDLLTALRALHAHGWVHRNITVRTVLVCDDGRILLTGLAAGAAEEALCGYDPTPDPAGEPATGPGPLGDPGLGPGFAGDPARGTGGPPALGQGGGPASGPGGPRALETGVGPGGGAAEPGRRGYGAADGYGPVGHTFESTSDGVAPGFGSGGFPGQHTFESDPPASGSGPRESGSWPDTAPATGMPSAPPAGPGPAGGHEAEGRYPAANGEDARAARAGAIAAYRAGALAAARKNEAERAQREHPEHGEDTGAVDAATADPATPGAHDLGMTGTHGFGPSGPAAPGTAPHGGPGSPGSGDSGPAGPGGSPTGGAAGHGGAVLGGPAGHRHGSAVGSGRSDSAPGGPDGGVPGQGRSSYGAESSARGQVHGQIADPYGVRPPAESTPWHGAAPRAGSGSAAEQGGPSALLPSQGGPREAGATLPSALPPAGQETPGRQVGTSGSGSWPTASGGPRQGSGVRPLSAAHTPRADGTPGGPGRPSGPGGAGGPGGGASLPAPRSGGWAERSQNGATPAPRGGMTQQAPGADGIPVDNWDEPAGWDGPPAGDRAPRGPASALAAERARQARMAVVGPVTERWAPEQAGPVHENWQLAPPVGPATDLWALGALLFRAVQGHAPYPEESTPELVEMVCSEPPAFAEECGPLRPVVESLLRQDPAERPDFEELRGWLRSLVRSAPEPDAGTHVVATPPLDGGTGRLPIVRRRGEIVRRRKAGLPDATGHGRHKRGGEQRPKRLGRTLLIGIILALAAAVAYAMVFLPKAGTTKGDAAGDRAATAGDQSAAPSEPADSETGSGGSSGEDSGKGGQRTPDKSPGSEPQTTGEGLPDGFTLRKDSAGFRIAVPDDWQRQPQNGNGQVIYSKGDFELIVVPGRDGAKDYGSDPMAYQADKEHELQPFRDSSWVTSTGLRRTEVGDRVMAEGQFTWPGADGDLYVRNMALLVNGRYHVVQVRGPEGERDKITSIYEQASTTYDHTG